MEMDIGSHTLEMDNTLVLNRGEAGMRLDIHRYLRGRRHNFSDYHIRLEPFTPFQRRVITSLRQIPKGVTVSYSRLGEMIGKPDAYRAVADTCRRNPLPLIVPCHRVVGSHSLGGYQGGKELKRKLLRMEI